jgi:alpha-L-rhamnosidase
VSRPLLYLILIAGFACTGGGPGRDTKTAPPDDSAWSARWIVPAAPADPTEPNRWYCFRKSFGLTQVPSSAVSRIAVDSKYWLWVNGHPVVFEGGLKRGPNPNDTYYDTVDLSEHLAEGVNSIAILLWYWGKHGFSHNSSGTAGLLFQAELDGLVIESDASWQCTRHPAYARTGPPHPNFRLPESNIRFDARSDLPGWTERDYDDSGWGEAEEAGPPPTPPWNGLVKRPTPLWRDSGLLAYERAPVLPRAGRGDTLYAVLPRNLSVTPYLRIDAPAGLEIRLQTDNYRVGGRRGEPTIRAEYVTTAGIQEFESLAYMTGHRVRYEIPAGVTILDLRYRETRYDTELAGSFACDDDFYTTLWSKARDTMILNMRDGIQDPDRERAQWWGDAVNVLGQVLYVCDTGAHALVRKAIHNLVDWRKPDGTLFSPVPAGNWSGEVPQQMLAAIGRFGIWRYFAFTGDTTTVRYAYPAVLDYLSLWEARSDGLVARRPGDMDWADWGANVDAPLLENAWYYIALAGAARMADLAGEEADAARFRARMATLRRGFNTHFWTEGGYRSPAHGGETDDRGNGLAVVAGIADSTRWDVLTDLLHREMHASPYLEKYVLEALFLMGDHHGALQRMRRRYQRMVESEISTLWEHWYRVAGSYNHGWAGGPLILLSEYVAGVAPETPGYGTYHVIPTVGDLERIEAVVPTVRGAIQVSITRGDSAFEMDLKSPPSTTAIVGVPKGVLPRVSRITVNGATAWADGVPTGVVEGVGFQGEDPRHYRFVVAPGAWEFTATS